MTEWGIDTLFNPGKRHMDEEKRRLQSTREEVGDASGGRRIDLESGTVTISRRGKSAPPAAADSEQDTQRSARPDAEETEPVSQGPAAVTVSPGAAAVAEQAEQAENGEQADNGAGGPQKAATD
ncbi:MAG TPA: DUF6191 domain-containing protein [Jatrophihabitans sp.]|jgi:hypothetical protein|uniref:DUF6191 domain-containing protein n=1 Tax=Jatrophihabitans sp. TaxID=1932789 RepID=UPI002F0CE62F